MGTMMKKIKLKYIYKGNILIMFNCSIDLWYPYKAFFVSCPIAMISILRKQLEGENVFSGLQFKGIVHQTMEA